MKFTLVALAALVGVATASHLAGPLALPAAVNTGASSQYRSQDNLGQYSFGYDEAGATGCSFRHEKSDAYGNRVGSYGLRGADGRVRVVNYVADANGYRANVQTNEPGTESRDTAGVAMNKAPVAVAAPLIGAAPLPVPIAAAPLPVAAAAPLPLELAPAPLAHPVAAAPFPLAPAPLAPAPLAAAPLPLAAAPLPFAAAPLPLAAAPLPLAAAPLPLAAAPLPLAAPAPLPIAAAPAGFGYNYVNQHLAPLPAY